MTKCDQKTSRDNFFFNFMCIREGLVWHCRRWVSTPFAARLVFCCFFTQLINKLQQCSLCEWIKNILLFVLNTKQPLRDIWLLRYMQNSFGCFQKNSEFPFFKNTQNCFAYNSATKYRSEAVLYSKQTAGYPLSPHKKIVFEE